MLHYRYNDRDIDIRETRDDSDDIEFLIHVRNEKHYLAALRAVRSFFEDNRDYTDVLFYSYPDHSYKVIVHQEHETDFLLALLKHRIVEALEWRE